MPASTLDVVLASLTLVLLAAGTVAIGYACWRVRLRAGVPLVGCAAVSTLNRAVWWLGVDAAWIWWARTTWLPLVMAALFLCAGLLMISDIDLIVVGRRVRRRRPV